MFNALYFRTFITLVETGSFTRTARSLEMTQPGVSQHIRKLEEYLNKPLLRRQGRRFTLTEAGRRAYDYALRLFAEHEKFYHSLDDEAVHSGECWIASTASVGMMFYPFTLSYQQLYPALTINYTFDKSPSIIHDMRDGLYDLGLVNELPQRGDPDLVFDLWHHEPLCLVVPADIHGDSFAELLALGFISDTNGAEYATRLLRSNYPNDFQLMSHIPTKGTVSEDSHVLDAVSRGLGFGIVSRPVLETSPWQRQVREIPLENPVYEEIYIVRRAEEDLPRRYQLLLNDYHDRRHNELYELQAPNTDT